MKKGKKWNAYLEVVKVHTHLFFLFKVLVYVDLCILSNKFQVIHDCLDIYLRILRFIVLRLRLDLDQIDLQ